MRIQLPHKKKAIKYEKNEEGEQEYNGDEELYDSGKEEEEYS